MFYLFFFCRCYLPNSWRWMSVVHFVDLRVNWLFIHVGSNIVGKTVSTLGAVLWSMNTIFTISLPMWRFRSTWNEEAYGWQFRILVCKKSELLNCFGNIELYIRKWKSRGCFFQPYFWSYVGVLIQYDVKRIQTQWAQAAPTPKQCCIFRHFLDILYRKGYISVDTVNIWVRKIKFLNFLFYRWNLFQDIWGKTRNVGMLDGDGNLW